MNVFKTMQSIAVIGVLAATGAHAEGTGVCSGDACLHDAVSTINGHSPPGERAGLVDVITMIDTVMADGNRLVVTKGTRRAGTRVGIHIHKYGGHTCVMSGAITDFVEGHAPALFPAGTCYYMPPNLPMTAVNLGTEDAVLIDTFILPVGEPPITIIED